MFNEIDPSDDVSPLITPSELHSTAMILMQVMKVVCLEELVAEFGE